MARSLALLLKRRAREAARVVGVIGLILVVVFVAGVGCWIAVDGMYALSQIGPDHGAGPDEGNITPIGYYPTPAPEV